MNSVCILTVMQLLYADIATIKNYCITNKMANHICNNIEFWLEKFKHDNVPIISLNIITGRDYMKEYSKVAEAQHNATLILNYINNYPWKRQINFKMDMDDTNYLKMFPSEHQSFISEQKNKLNQPTGALILLDLTKGANKNLDYNIVEKTVGFSSPRLLRLIGHIIDTFDFLTKLFYYYPNIKINNNDWQPIMDIILFK